LEESGSHRLSLSFKTSRIIAISAVWNIVGCLTTRAKGA
jgi:hypothetical protein